MSISYVLFIYLLKSHKDNYLMRSTYLFLYLSLSLALHFGYPLSTSLDELEIWRSYVSLNWCLVLSQSIPTNSQPVGLILSLELLIASKDVKLHLGQYGWRNFPSRRILIDYSNMVVNIDFFFPPPIFLVDCFIFNLLWILLCI